MTYAQAFRHDYPEPDYYEPDITSERDMIGITLIYRYDCDGTSEAADAARDAIKEAIDEALKDITNYRHETVRNLDADVIDWRFDRH